ncbi:ribosomal protein L7/L12 [Streptomyces sp. HD]|uniref:ribosomal protein L7/L12 n=1 Tax=Streptomyces sp. HD TaxID=3020892 RepID=UPI00232C0D3A|nr:ribosomal protein L7/L12 [Streptomyces sp. HD]MDC0770487.1 ribosomal protein L7/L12 [Streptomyces sp. HD]
MEIVGLFFFVVGMTAVWSIQSRISQADRRVARVERKLDSILDHLGLREEEPRMDEVVALVRQGKQIPAIKLYREITGAGLKEAKEAVDRLG